MVSMLQILIHIECTMVIETNMARIYVTKSFNIFDDDVKDFSHNVFSYDGATHTEDISNQLLQASISEKQDSSAINVDLAAGLICSICHVKFENRDMQRDHFLLDWHRFNAKQKVLAKSPLTEDEFEHQIADDLSSISGSDSDDDMCPTSGLTNFNAEVDDVSVTNEQHFFVKHPQKRFFLTKNGELFSIHRNVAPVKWLDNGNLNAGVKWMYLLLSSGHFAGAVYHRNSIVVHKTFHRYTIRAKRGTSQSANDNKQNKARSAGASIRRHNEAALIQDIQDLLVSWSQHIQDVSKIFYKCSSCNASTLFNERTKLFKGDDRLRRISLIARRPTVKEVRRIHANFSLLECHGAVVDFEETYCQQAEIAPANVVKVSVQPQAVIAEIKHAGTHLKDKTTKPKKKKKLKSDEEVVKATLEILEKQDEEIWMWNSVYDWCATKDFTSLKQFFYIEAGNCQNNEDFLRNHLNYCSQSKNGTLLHCSVATGNRELVGMLLELGADPCVKNADGKLPYEIATSKEVRNEFRRFRSRHPDRFDYTTAKIAQPLTEEEERLKHEKEAERRKQQSKSRKERLKVKRGEERLEKLEEKARKEFNALSDREKRAVMAERRFASQLTDSSRCASCRSSISPKDAFTRFEYKYCSTECVQKHKEFIGK